MASLLSLHKGFSVTEGRRDARIWIPNPSLRLSYNSLFGLSVDSAPPKKSVFDVIWRTKVPKKVRFFIWQVLLGRVNTIDGLVRRRSLLVGFFFLLFVVLDSGGRS